ncbi:MAG: hypothetical protein V3V99_00240 [candidate division Zixibacteria bacterium]
MRQRNFLAVLGIILFISLGLISVGNSRALYDLNENPGIMSPRPNVDLPNKQFVVHNIGKLAMTITNFGTFGTGYVSGTCDGEICPSAEYPINSDIEYLFTASFWIGAVVGRDTLVSIGADGWAQQVTELLPDPGDAGAIQFRSNIPSRSDYSPDAVSEQDYICVFTDTNVDQAGVDGNDNRPHIPLNVSITQSTYAWSYDYAEDFVLFDYKIANMGIFPISDLYIAVYVDADVWHAANQQNGHTDDICGFRRTVDMAPGFGFDLDTVNIAYIADNDGDPVRSGGQLVWDFRSPVAATGTRVIRTPNEDLKYGFNWWVSNGDPALDFGPRMAGTDDDPFYIFGPHLGTPNGDRVKYHVMSHEEFDYDQLYSAVSKPDEGFLPPPQPSLAINIADGFDTRYLLSFGPFDVASGDTLPVTLAYLAGDSLHSEPADFGLHFDAYNPEVFSNTLDFSDFGKNARWADWVFDNPGYDTDGDLDSGRYNWSCQGTDSTLYFPEDETPDDSLLPRCTKIYYKGDGVPDFRGAAPPPPPVITAIPEHGKITLRWNGEMSQNSIDVFSGKKDFEGFRVYYSLSDRVSDFVLLTSFDVDDYKRFEYNEILQVWEQTSVPFTRDSLETLYGRGFEPLDYFDESNRFEDPTTNQFMYFAPQDWNQSDLSNPDLIHRIYPNSSRDDQSDTTDEGWLRYYEYEYVIDNLQPSVPYYFSVTAFDYGSLKVDLGALESSPLVNAVQDFALTSAEEVEKEGMDVIVYPNPYRIDGGYAASGYENRDRTKSAERTRVINFANLPKLCKIRIYSIDGDLIKQFDHYYPDGGPGSQHETWDVISRNTQAVVTGIYLWHVESDMGDQIGKLVIMK